jgi:serine/threonine protein kinase
LTGPIALKVIDDMAISEQYLERFYRQARYMAIAAHPGIVKVLEIGHDPNQQKTFIAMELASMSLTNYPKPFSNANGICQFVASIGDAVGYLHTIGIVHNSINPDHLFLFPNQTPKLGGFSFATRNSLFFKSQQSDICSLGCILFYLFHDSKAFGIPTTEAITSSERLTPPLKELIMRSITDQYQNVFSLIDDLHQM